MHLCCAETEKHLMCLLCSSGKHLQPVFGAAYLCPSVIPLLIWLLLFIGSHAISALHLALAFERLFWVLPQSLTFFFFALLRRCLLVILFFFPKHAIQMQTSAKRKRSKRGQMYIPATWVPIFPSGSDDSWVFLSPVQFFFSLVFSSMSRCTTPPPPFPCTALIFSSFFLNEFK